MRALAIAVALDAAHLAGRLIGSFIAGIEEVVCK